jgi:hypothetical protein
MTGCSKTVMWGQGRDSMSQQKPEAVPRDEPQDFWRGGHGTAAQHPRSKVD